MHALVSTCRSEEGVSLYPFLPYSLEVEPLPKTGAHDFQLSWQPADSSNPSAPTSLRAGVTGKCSTCKIVTWVLSPELVLTVVQQALSN